MDERVWVYRSPCRKDMRVQPVEGGFALAEGCEVCGLAAGSATADLAKACASCDVAAALPAVEASPMETKEQSGGNNVPTLLISAPPPGGVIAPPELRPPELEPEPVVEPPEPVVEPEMMGSDPNLTPTPALPEPEPAAQSSMLVSPDEALVLATPVMSQPEQKPRLGTPAQVAISGVIAAMSGEERVDIDKVLESIPGISGGPSTGGFSWHTLELTMRCWRLAYYSLVRGLVPKSKSHALAFGSLYHACWELWYKSGGQRRYDEPCDAVRQAGAPKLAGEVQRLVYTELMQFAQQERDEWDIRAVEQNAVFFGEPERINGKLVHIPFSCRHDMLISKKKADEPYAPPGPAPNGIWVVDRKTASALTYDLTKGYGMDGQFLTNALVFTRSTEQAQFGPFVGMIFAVAVKHKEPTDKSFFRIETTVDEQTLEDFYRGELRPHAIELYRRLSTPEYRENVALWPKNRAACVGRYGVCRFFDVCDGGGESWIDAMFDESPERQMNLEKLAEPPQEIKRLARAADPAKQAAEEARKTKGEEKKHLTSLVVEAFRAAALTLEHFKASRYLVANHTRKTVLDQLTLTLSGLYGKGVEFPFGPDAEGNNYQLLVTEKGFEWKLARPEPEAAVEGKRKPKKQPEVKGTMTFKAIAESICRDWWDLKNLEKNVKE